MNEENIENKILFELAEFIKKIIQNYATQKFLKLLILIMMV
jgi:hypothetical protein